MNSTSIALVTGGFSSENIVSFKSAKNVYEALLKSFNQVYWIEINEEEWYCLFKEKKYFIDKNDFSIIIENQKITFDFIYLIIHGTPAEDGLLPAYFDLLKIPYSCSNPLASQITFDKAATIKYAKALDIPCSPSVEISISQYQNEGCPILDFTFPVFVKACRSGSSFGVIKINSQDELSSALNEAFKFDKNCLIEQGMNGTEVTCGILETKNGIETIAITEVVSHNDFFDFEAKYNGDADEITPARISKEETQLVEDLTKLIYEKYNLSGICRIDYILVNHKPFLIEINTIPGMTNESFIPQQIEYSGKSLSVFLKEQVEFCLSQYKNEKA